MSCTICCLTKRKNAQLTVLYSFYYFIIIFVLNDLVKQGKKRRERDVSKLQ